MKRVTVVDPKGHSKLSGDWHVPTIHGSKHAHADTVGNVCLKAGTILLAMGMPVG